MSKLRELTLASLLLLAIAVGCSSGDVDPTECDRIRLSGPITLSDAAQYDCAVTARTLVEPQGSIPGVDVNAPDDDGNMPLYIAAKHNSVNVARILIESGADIDAKADDGGTALYWAIQTNSLDFVRLLIDHDADLTGTLLTTLYSDAVDIARLLIDSGADMEPNLSEGKTLLHYFASNDNPDFVSLLIDSGADIEGIDLSWMD
jgi:ankyrin repeat protein